MSMWRSGWMMNLAFIFTNLILGIDYGSKLAGTTTLAIADAGNITLERVQKKQDADRFIRSFVEQVDSVNTLYIDAPLSLPGVYRNLPGFGDYFYRKADRELKAMSPMFLGGLTARAMKLAKELASNHVVCKETYPASLARELGLHAFGYKKSTRNIPAVTTCIGQTFRIDLMPEVKSWHDVDAVLALMIGIRHEEGLGRAVGDKREGLIHI